MKTMIAVALACLAGSAYAQVSCTTIGAFTSCSDGRSFNQIGDNTFGSDGSSAQRIGNSTFITPGYTPPVYQPPMPVYTPPQPTYRPQQPYRAPVCGLTSMGQYVCQ